MPEFITIAHYWEKLSFDDRHHLINCLRSYEDKKWRMGTLPFCNAEKAYLALSRYPASALTFDSYVHHQKLLSVLVKHCHVAANPHYMDSTIGKRVEQYFADREPKR